MSLTEKIQSIIDEFAKDLLPIIQTVKIGKREKRTVFRDIITAEIIKNRIEADLKKNLSPQDLAAVSEDPSRLESVFKGQLENIVRTQIFLIVAENLPARTAESIEGRGRLADSDFIILEYLGGQHDPTDATKQFFYTFAGLFLTTNSAEQYQVLSEYSEEQLLDYENRLNKQAEFIKGILVYLEGFAHYVEKNSNAEKWLTTVNGVINAKLKSGYLVTIQTHIEQSVKIRALKKLRAADQGQSSEAANDSLAVAVPLEASPDVSAPRAENARYSLKAVRQACNDVNADTHVALQRFIDQFDYSEDLPKADDSNSKPKVDELNALLNPADARINVDGNNSLNDFHTIISGLVIKNEEVENRIAGFRTNLDGIWPLVPEDENKDTELRGSYKNIFAVLDAYKDALLNWQQQDGDLNDETLRGKLFNISMRINNALIKIQRLQKHEDPNVPDELYEYTKKALRFALGVVYRELYVESSKEVMDSMLQLVPTKDPQVPNEDVKKFDVFLDKAQKFIIESPQERPGFFSRIYPAQWKKENDEVEVQTRKNIAGCLFGNKFSGEKTRKQMQKLISANKPSWFKFWRDDRDRYRDLQRRANLVYIMRAFTTGHINELKLYTELNEHENKYPEDAIKVKELAQNIYEKQYVENMVFEYENAQEIPNAVNKDPKQDSYSSCLTEFLKSEDKSPRRDYIFTHGLDQHDSVVLGYLKKKKMPEKSNVAGIKECAKAVADINLAHVITNSL